MTLTASNILGLMTTIVGERRVHVGGEGDGVRVGIDRAAAVVGDGKFSRDGIDDRRQSQKVARRQPHRHLIAGKVTSPYTASTDIAGPDDTALEVDLARAEDQLQLGVNVLRVDATDAGDLDLLMMGPNVNCPVVVNADGLALLGP